MHAVTSYNQDSQFTTSALSRLEGVGIPVMTSLNNSVNFFQQILGVLRSISYPSAFPNASSVLNAWSLSGIPSRRLPTWKNLLLIIRLLNLDDLAQRIETYLSGMTDQEERYSSSELSEAERESKGELISHMCTCTTV